MIYIGIDIGTSKISAVAVDITTGKMKAVTSLPNNSGIVYKDKTRQKWAEQNPVVVKKIAFKVLRKLIMTKKFQLKNVKGIGLTGQMHGMLLVDENLSPLTNLITWQDQRCEDLFHGKKHTYISEMIQKAGGKNSFYNSGCNPATGYMGSTLFWLKTNKFLPKPKYKATFIHDYIASSLTGNRNIYTDPTDAGSSGIFNIINNKWNYELIGKLGLPEEIFPQIKVSGEVIGKTSASVEKEIGLSQGIPVCCPIGDNQASMIGSCSDYKDVVLINIGTGSQISVVIDKFRSLQGIDTRYFPNNQYALVYAGLSGGQSYLLLERFFKDAGYAFWKIKNKKSLLSKMNELAASVSSNLHCEPLFYGTRENPSKRGSFTNVSFGNMTTAYFCRAVLEGMVEELYNMYNRMVKKGFNNYKKVIGTGNAVKKNPFLCKIISKKFGLPLKLTAHDEEAAYGAAIIAAAKTNGSVEDAMRKIR